MASGSYSSHSLIWWRPGWFMRFPAAILAGAGEHFVLSTYPHLPPFPLPTHTPVLNFSKHRAHLPLVEQHFGYFAFSAAFLTQRFSLCPSPLPLPCLLLLPTIISCTVYSCTDMVARSACLGGDNGVYVVPCCMQFTRKHGDRFRRDRRTPRLDSSARAKDRRRGGRSPASAPGHACRHFSSLLAPVCSLLPHISTIAGRAWNKQRTPHTPCPFAPRWTTNIAIWWMNGQALRTDGLYVLHGVGRRRTGEPFNEHCGYSHCRLSPTRGAYLRLNRARHAVPPSLTPPYPLFPLLCAATYPAYLPPTITYISFGRRRKGKESGKGRR